MNSRPDFSNPQNNNSSESFYDLFEDYDLIEASFAQQYGIRLSREGDMTWREFSTLLAGLNGDTPLGNIVSIRAEKDSNVIKNFSPEQKRIRAEWQVKHAKRASKEEYEAMMRGLEAGFKSMSINNK